MYLSAQNFSQNLSLGIYTITDVFGVQALFDTR